MNKQRTKIYFPETNPQARLISSVSAAALVVIACIGAYNRIGLPAVYFIGGVGIISYIFWQIMYVKRPVDPNRILPLFLITAAVMEIHVIEEYMMNFGPAISRLFDISFSEQRFLLIFALATPVVFTLTAIGLFYRVPIAGFVAWFTLVAAAFQCLLFVLPICIPAIAPGSPQTITAAVGSGTTIHNMPNYFYKISGHHYFPGMWTAILPMASGITAIVKLFHYHWRNLRQFLL